MLDYPQAQIVPQAFNRTSVELKHLGDSDDIYEISDTFNRTSVELKPLYRPRVYLLRNLTFNRTSVELKRGLLFCGSQSLRGPLIEPVWN